MSDTPTLPAPADAAPIMVSESNPLILKLRRSGQLREEDEPVLRDLCTPIRRIPADQDVVREGDSGADVHLVLDGVLARYKLLPEGRRQIIGLLLPGDFCDLQSVILGEMDHSIAALAPSTIAEVPQRIVDALTLSHSRIARALWWATLVDESVLREWLVNMGQRPADRRVAHLVCELLLRFQVVGRAEERACEIPLTQTELGDILGLTNVHINRVLQDLRGRGLLTVRGRRFEVPDVAALRAFCGFDPAYLHLRPARRLEGG
ncbi:MULTISPECIES: Crp/Fnr family transcriptional regulator [Methylobacterium]|uniref:Crp/Fnr family transcriptional regulator n=1 Tax=Methylobacterium jeotgali TaxID=381630 RepID=A0ABQ4SUA9_9HYPH|nr:MULTISPECIES: Crp/Fnr family transcriptional regulator [Methylobacterium]PIU04237.1 MAG: Crp/Fnr family transcriptional regulator [Methylobacterium sp. CG09_land_8_20_14_0_10_71_15]PIU15189.1 MAG: Crp/Fnr family transcriptional regulator [Methylobacterium sp. CG08_land_8_20_14_0_20_71_15]GBU19146.1 Crp/Fnr family transcriptional regulator [Methylobacterium sp.]GJE06682.1 hypothetical protein AOPFMNJM_2004 [Methylobacterium jeotgali]